MKTVTYTLLSDGSSDRALMPLLDWLLRTHLPTVAIQGSWADLRRLPQPPRQFVDRIKMSMNLFPCDLLFIHRDAENVPHPERVREIVDAVMQSRATADIAPTICVVPVRMQEAWLLFDEMAIRAAAGNPHGRSSLKLPRVRDVEDIPDPKDVLHALLRDATGLHGRRRRHTTVSTLAHRVAELVDDFSPLRQVRAFAALEDELLNVITEQGWIEY